MLTVSVISPERILFEGTVDSLVAPAFDGEVGILPKHAPMMALVPVANPSIPSVILAPFDTAVTITITIIAYSIQVKARNPAGNNFE